MSECVVRMEMPSNCWVCPFGLDGYIWDENDARTHYVRFCSRHSGEEFHVLETDTIDRPWYCDSFICSLPEGHGRLVEAKALFERVYEYYGQDNESNENWMMEMINGAPTIVPAEGAKHEVQKETSNYRSVPDRQGTGH